MGWGGGWGVLREGRKVPESDARSVGTDMTVEAAWRPRTHVNMRRIHPGKKERKKERGRKKEKEKKKKSSVSIQTIVVLFVLV